VFLKTFCSWLLPRWNFFVILQSKGKNKNICMQ
jgi:hypothetical protein